MMRTCAAVAVAWVGASAMAGPPEWPQFRGPGAVGVADPQTPPVEISPDKNVKWKVPVPGGFSSPVVAGDKIFLTGFDDGKLLTLAYSRTDGKELWRAEAPAKKIEVYHKTENSPASATSVTDGERVISYFASAGVFAYDLAGKELWRFEMPTAETGFDFGSGASPVLVDGKLVLARDLKNDNSLYCLDAKTGSQIWKTPRTGFATAWATPAVWETPAGKQLVVPGTGRMAGYDLTDGSEKWTVKGMPSAPCTTPVVIDGLLMYAGWSPGEDFKLPTYTEMLKDQDKNGNGVLDKEETKGSFLYDFFDNNDPNKDGKITKEEWESNIKSMAAGKNSAFVLKPGGTGDITTTHVVWKATKGLPYVPSPLVYKGVMYTANMRGLVTAREVKTGKELWLDENLGLNGIYASPIGANGHVYLIGLDGGVVVLKADDVPVVAYRGKLGERVAATPAVVDSTMYVRTAKHLYAFGK